MFLKEILFDYDSILKKTTKLVSFDGIIKNTIPEKYAGRLYFICLYLKKNKIPINNTNISLLINYFIDNRYTNYLIQDKYYKVELSKQRTKETWNIVSLSIGFIQVGRMIYTYLYEKSKLFLYVFILITLCLILQELLTDPMTKEKYYLSKIDEYIFANNCSNDNYILEYNTDYDNKYSFFKNLLNRIHPISFMLYINTNGKVYNLVIPPETLKQIHNEMLEEQVKPEAEQEQIPVQQEHEQEQVKPETEQIPVQQEQQQEQEQIAVQQEHEQEQVKPETEQIPVQQEQQQEQEQEQIAVQQQQQEQQQVNKPKRVKKQPIKKVVKKKNKLNK